MSEREEALLEQLEELARSDDPPPLSADRERELVLGALGDARKRERKHRFSWTAGVSVAAAAAVALLTTSVALLATQQSTPTGETAGFEPMAPSEAPMAESPTAQPAREPATLATDLVLPTGDRLLAAAGASFRLSEASLEERRVSLDRGSMLFDVARLGDNEHFEVVTPDMTVRVLGTIFSVETAEEGSTVRVFEGRVEVQQGELLHVLSANESVGPNGTIAAVDDDGVLSRQGWEAAAARLAAATEESEPPEVATATGVEVAVHEPGIRRSVPEPELDELPSAAEARASLTGGEPERALELARRALRGAPGDGAWKMLEADALRALSRPAEAVDAYTRAADASTGSRRAQAGYLAASLSLRNLGDPAAALTQMDRFEVDAAGSALRERGLSLRARALSAAGRTAEAQDVARRYLDEYPSGGMSTFMQSLLPAAD